MLENNFNVNKYVFEPVEWTDVASGTITYIGLSGQSDGAQPLWRIKRLFTDGTVTTIQYPNGDQSLTYVWNNRASYTYK
jgi:hypothetical protein